MNASVERFTRCVIVVAATIVVGLVGFILENRCANGSGLHFADFLLLEDTLGVGNRLRDPFAIDLNKLLTCSQENGLAESHTRISLTHQSTPAAPAASVC